jgi:hypothetical protein
VMDEHTERRHATRNRPRLGVDVWITLPGKCCREACANRQTRSRPEKLAS